jgi:hypothetical protein
MAFTGDCALNEDVKWLHDCSMTLWNDLANCVSAAAAEGVGVVRDLVTFSQQRKRSHALCVDSLWICPVGVKESKVTEYDLSNVPVVSL